MTGLRPPILGTAYPQLADNKLLKGTRIMAIRSRNLAFEVTEGATGTDRGPSHSLWAQCPWFELENNPFLGYNFMDDFTKDGVVAATNVSAVASLATGQTGNWVTFTDNSANCVMATLATDVKGVVTMATDTTNVGCTMAWPKTAETAGPIQIKTGQKFWMEARIKNSVLTDDITGTFIGLCGKGLLASGEVILDDDSINADSHIGFFQRYADGR